MANLSGTLPDRMSNRKNDIPVYTLPPGAGGGMMIMQQSLDGSPGSPQVERPHRDSGYTFILQQQGITHIEIDFQVYQLKSPAVIFIRPGQVHRVIAFEQATITTWMITSENLRPDYVQALNDLAPQNALSLTTDAVAPIVAAAALCLTLFKAKPPNRVLQDACNTLAGLVVWEFAAQVRPAANISRFESVSNRFKKVLDAHFKTIKRPAAYADMLNISVSYLNECVHAATGSSVSDSIRERVVLEAKRLLYHSSRSVKEIAAELGYDDFSYFTRIFVKTVGETPQRFRAKNRD